MAKKGGCCTGRALHIDLSRGSWTVNDIDDETRHRFLGGAGLNAPLALKMIPPGIDPLSPENVILIGAGALTGTEAFGTPKTEIVSKSPLTGTIGTALTGHFGAPLKWAGYDQLIITGRSPQPCYLRIFNDEIEICDASELWGRDIYATTETLWERYAPLETTVAAIGQAGENRVRFSLILINKCSTWGRGGLAAVWGSKNLKAVVVYGAKGLPIANQRAFKRLLKHTNDKVMSDRSRELWSEVGTMVTWEIYAKMGNLHVDNWDTSISPEYAVERFGIDAFRQQTRKRSIACSSCPIACKAELEVKEGRFAGLNTNTSCNMVAGMFYAAASRAEGLAEVTKLNDTANRYGLDNISMGNLAAYVRDLHANGIIPESDLGVAVNPGVDGTLRLLEMVALRQGIGDVLAEGWHGITAHYGAQAEELAVQIRGMDPPFEPRANLGTENLGIFTCPRGGHATAALSMTVVPGRRPEQLAKYCKLLGIPPERVGEFVYEGAPGSYGGVNVGRLLRHVEDVNAAYTAAGICSRPPIQRLYTLDDVCSYLQAGAGLDISTDDLKRAGERIITTLTLFNLREGISRSTLQFPRKWLTRALKHQDVDLPALDEDILNTLLDDYYAERGWMIEEGRPAPENLADLELEPIAAGSG